MLKGSNEVANEDGERTSAQVWSLSAGLGLWRGLSVRLALPLLDLSATTDSGTTDAVALGDLSAQLGYRFTLGGDGRMFAFSLTSGAYLPTGGAGADAALPSNPNFASGTVNPMVGGHIGMQLAGGLGGQILALARIVPQASDEGYRAGNSVVFGGGAHYVISENVVPSLDLIGLLRGADSTNDDDPHAGHSGAMTGAMDSNPEGSGGRWLFVVPGLSYRFTAGSIDGMTIGLRVQVPVYQDLNGTQLAEGISAGVSLRHAFSVF